MDSPLAKALLRKAIDDEVQISVAGNSETFLITGIRYE
jgi:transcription elongation GreA/GreB family factor